MPVTDVIAIHGPTRFDRPIYAGNAIETVSSGQPKNLLTIRASAFRPAREAATFYIELVRGLPMLVILYYIAFVGAPALASALNWLLSPLIGAGLITPVQSRSFDFATRAVLALTLGYAAFIAEIFRAGIESVGRGQVEAAYALGMSRRQAMIRIILPQATRTAVPPLSNTFISLVKDTSLAAAITVPELFRAGQRIVATTYEPLIIYVEVALIYLVVSSVLSTLQARIERRYARYGGYVGAAS
jgi:ABC-type amino acid transport system permease subunit